jgi:glycosyltransferase involved in cell wall biosynthesis
MVQFTLVSTVFNEAKRLDQTIADLNAQTVQPSEIVITDAGSTDGTYERLLQWRAESSVPIIILQKHKCNVAEGRNKAIRTAKYDIIASTDFGCRFHQNWLKTLIAPFENPDVNIVGGAYSVKEEDQITLAAKAAFILSGGYTPDVHADWFIPSSRSIAYKKAVFEAVGGYCEWLTLAADDYIFGKEVLAKGYAFHPVDKPYVYWIRHTKGTGFIKEAFRYGLGDGEARVNQRNFISNLIETTLRYLLFVCIVATVLLAAAGISPATILLLNMFFIPGLRSYFNYLRNWLKYRSHKYNLKVLFYGFVLLERTRLSYLKGYFRGLLHATPNQKEQAAVLKKRLSLT